MPAFYGWRIVGVAFVADFVATGFFFYSYGIFFKALAADFGGSRLAVSFGISLANVVGALLSPYLGRSLDRSSIRTIMLCGSLSTAAGFALASQIGALWQFYLILSSLVALGIVCMGGITAATLVSNWFVARRGTALGVATMGISLSGLAMPPIATALIASYGWRGSFALYAVATLCLVTPPVAIWAVNRPEDVGLQPDGAPPPDPATPAHATDRPWRTRELLREPRFWAISLAFSLSFCSVSAVLIHLVPHATDLGIEPVRAAWLLSTCAGAGVLGKVVFGRLVDRVDPRVAVWISFGTQLAGLVWIAFAAGEAALFAGAAIFGLGMGGMVPLQGTLTGLAFGRLSYGKVAGLMRPFQVPIHATGIPFAGWIFDRTGSYDTAFAVFACAYLLALATITLFRPGPTRAVTRGSHPR